MSSKAGYLSNLTPLRGMAAILVAIFHFEMAIARFVPAARTMFFEKSYLMVDLFFVLSGFIMLHVYGDSFHQTLRKDSVRHFFVARFARTYPLHLFTLLLLVLIVRYLTNWGNPPILLEQPSDILPMSFYYNLLEFAGSITGISHPGALVPSGELICYSPSWRCGLAAPGRLLRLR